ncbi:MAG TPA: aconitate hydratase B, partial [Halothiobacillus sp.]
MLEAYLRQQQEREQQGVPPKALTVEQTARLIELIKIPPTGEDGDFLLYLLTECVPPGVDQAAYVKAAFLTDVAQGKATSPLIDRVQAVEWLGTMIGGYNIDPLITMLDDAVVGDAAATALKRTVLIYDAFRDVEDKMRAGNARAKAVIESWAAAEWFTHKPAMAEEITVTVFKVPGETNTDDLSPAQDAWSRPDIPLHALAMLGSKMPDGLKMIEALKQKGHPIAYVGDVVGTGSSRKSAINSVQWYIGRDIPHVPNKRTSGVILGSKIAPIFFNTAEDSGALPIEVNVDQLETGDVVTIRPYSGELLRNGVVIERFDLRPTTLPDEVRAGGRIMLIIGRALTDRAR